MANRTPTESSLPQIRIPNNLPPPVRPFVDREEEIARVTKLLLDPDVTIVNIVGLAGVGKTALALEVAHRLLEQGQFPDGMCWVYGRDRDQALAEILKTVQRTFDLSPQVTARDAVRQYLSSRRALLVLNEYDAITDDLEVLGFLGSLVGPSKAVLTSRSRAVRLARTAELRLNGLPLEDGIRLFEQTIESYGARIPPDEETSVAELVQLLSGHTLAIRLAAAQAARGTLPLDMLKQRLSEGWLAPELKTVFDASTHMLSEPARTLFRRLAVFAADFDEQAIHGVCQVDGWQDAVVELEQAGLLQRVDDRYQLHPMVRAAALAELERHNEREEYEQRAAAYYLELAQAAESAIHGGQLSGAPEVIHSDIADMLAGQEWYWTHEHWHDVIAYGDALYSLLDPGSFLNDRLTAVQRALAASKRKGDTGAEARFLYALANTYRVEARWWEAIELYEQSLTLYQRLGDRLNEANVLQALGDALYYIKWIDRALASFDRALDLYRALGSRLGEANVLKAQGDVLAFQDRRDEALACYEQALGLFRAVGDRLGEANVLQAQGDVLAFQKQNEEALARYEQALGLFRAVGARLGEANVLQAQGDVLAFQKQNEEALARYEQALGLFRAVGARLGEANTLTSLANVHQFLAVAALKEGDIRKQQTEYREALLYLDKSSDLFESIGDVASLAFVQRLRAHILDELKEREFDEAIAALTKVLTSSLTSASQPASMRAAGSIVEFGKRLVAQGRYHDTLHLATRLTEEIEKIERDANRVYKRPLSPKEVETHRMLREHPPAYQTLIRYDPQVLETAGLIKSILSVIARVATARINGTQKPDYDAALQALELGREADKTTGQAFHLAQWVRELSGFEFVELEDADDWPPQAAYLVHLAARHERDENWQAAIDIYRQACELLSPAKSEKELARSAEIGFRLALCLKQAGRWSEAIKQQEANIATYRKLGDLTGKANAYMEMGHIYQMMNLYDPALLYYGEAYYLYRQAAEATTDEAARRSARHGMANAKESLGNLEFQLKVLPKGVTDLEEAKALYLDLDMPGKAAVIGQTLETPQAVPGGNHA
jgi:tetratricopeptide (TPR) repeat protein